MSLSLFTNSLARSLSPCITSSSFTFLYSDLTYHSDQIASILKNIVHVSELQEARVAYMLPATFEYASVQMGVWKSGGIAVPLCTTHPAAELEYFLMDCQASVVLYHPSFSNVMEPLVAKLKIKSYVVTDLKPVVNNKVEADRSFEKYLDLKRRAMLIYTSGTTGKPKGVVYTFSMLEAQMNAMISSWEWTSRDHTLNVLPLHHVHGVVNVVTTALYVGAKLTMMPKFNAAEVWKKFHTIPDLNVFMAVPTVYAKMISEFKNVHFC